MKPQVSVIIPCFNGARYVGDAIESVLNQTLAAHEVIVVDDGSTDPSFNIASSYPAPVRTIRQSNQGEGGARNAGAALATGTHLFFLDADDLIASDALKEMAEAAAANDDAMVLMRSAEFQDESSHLVSVPSNPPNTFFPGLIHNCLGVPHTWLTPAPIFRRTRGFSSRISYFVDWEFWCQGALLARTLVAIPYVGALYRRHGETMSANTPPL